MVPRRVRVCAGGGKDEPAAGDSGEEGVGCRCDGKANGQASTCTVLLPAWSPTTSVSTVMRYVTLNGHDV